MADDHSHILWCTYCQMGGHEIVQCHAMYQDLINFAEQAALQSAQGMAPGFKVAHWGQGSKNKALKRSAFYDNAHCRPVGFATASTIPPWNPSHPWMHGTNLTSTEIEMLVSYLEQQRISWLWSRQMWAFHMGYYLPANDAGNDGAGWGDNSMPHGY